MNAHTTITPHPTMLRGCPPIAILRALPPGPLAKEHERLRRLAEVFASFDRADMEASVDLLLAEMDARDGDPDEDTGGAEDEPLTGAAMIPDGKPGCSISDPDFGVEDAAGSGSSGDRAYAEWDTLPTNRRRAGLIDGKPLDPCRTSLEEDEEDDDAAEADGDERDGNGSEEDFMRHRENWRGRPGCPVSDPAEGTHPDNFRHSAIMVAYVDDEEPWRQPAIMDGPVSANDQVRP